MRTITVTIIAIVVTIGACNLQGAIDWDFYDDGTIQEGDEYANVRLFDTPPDHTTVDMTGGSAYNILTYDSSTLNVSGGQTEVFAYNQSTINVNGGTIYTLEGYDSTNVNIYEGSTNHVNANNTSTINIFYYAELYTLDALDQGIVNMSGGTVDRLGSGGFGTVNLSGGIVSENLVAWDSGIINVFGYDLGKIETGGAFGNGFVWGKWEGEIPFSFDFYGSDTHSHIILHEIPEPSMLALIMAGVLFLRKKQM
jgi:hypothetical protein